MGISFYYAVRILWRECGREFLTNVHKQKSPKNNLRTFCGMDETRARATRVQPPPLYYGRFRRHQKKEHQHKVISSPCKQFIWLKICALGKIDYLCARKHLWDVRKIRSVE